ncbi:DUF3841 domain-containing protein [Anaerotignum sp.]
MKLWTVQPLFIYEQLSKGMTYYCDEELCSLLDIDHIKQAYEWMAQQMEKRVSLPPEGVKYPVWAWHTIGGKHKTPDLRQAMFRNFKGSYVCIELEIPDDEVLLSDYDAWHMVLNDQYIDFSFSEDEYNRAIAYFESLSKEEQKNQKIKSWDNVFFITPYHNAWTSMGEYIQATFWELKPEYMKSVRFIKEKK